MTALLTVGDRVELTAGGRRLFKMTPDRRGFVFREPYRGLVTIKWDGVGTRKTIHVSFVQRIEMRP